jgi:hypothetical protein
MLGYKIIEKLQQGLVGTKYVSRLNRMWYKYVATIACVHLPRLIRNLTIGSGMFWRQRKEKKNPNHYVSIASILNRRYNNRREETKIADTYINVDMHMYIPTYECLITLLKLQFQIAVVYKLKFCSLVHILTYFNLF